MNSMRMSNLAIVFCLTVGSADSALAVSSTVGNLWVTVDTQLREYTPNGVLIQSINVPFPVSGPNQGRRVAGVLVDCSGNVQMANYAVSSYGSYLSTYTPALETWHHTSHGATLTDISNGDLAQYADKVIMRGRE